MRPSVHLGFFDRSVPAGSHICVFYSDPATRDEVVMPFLAQGLRTGEKCICALASLGPKEVLARLGHHVDLDLSVERGQLELADPAERLSAHRQVCPGRHVQLLEGDGHGGTGC